MNQICKVCKIEKDLHNDFYASTNRTGYDTTCKVCRLAQQAMRDKAKKNHPPKHNLHEQDFIQACYERGIYAVQATTTKNHKFCDVVAWGCVRIEVKYPDIINDGNMYHWRFTVNQAHKRLPVDLIVLVTECFGQTHYHIFDPLDPVFFNPDQTRKRCLSYIVEREKGYRTEYGVIMTTALLTYYQDAFSKIEDVRLEKSRQLKQVSRKNR